MNNRSLTAILNIQTGLDQSTASRPCVFASVFHLLIFSNMFPATMRLCFPSSDRMMPRLCGAKVDKIPHFATLCGVKDDRIPLFATLARTRACFHEYILCHPSVWRKLTMNSLDVRDVRVEIRRHCECGEYSRFHDGYGCSSDGSFHKSHSFILRS